MLQGVDLTVLFLETFIELPALARHEGYEAEVSMVGTKLKSWLLSPVPLPKAVSIMGHLHSLKGAESTGLGVRGPSSSSSSTLFLAM